ncbi:MAG: methylenetetrahydrofolate reductase [NAD(P)H] [Ruminococcaceae bacterium]|nr:methylenetetrahydrofolate reductase [NAD(P)H] [Oscillospiraceae bacterium]
MNIFDKLKSNEISTSFEVFPPKNDAPFEPVKNAVKELSALKPSFISVTYGAGGGTSKNTPAIVSYIQDELNLPSVAHLTCASSTKDEIDRILQDLKSRNIKNILALRGDRIEGAQDDGNHYRYASEMISRIAETGGFSIGAACYPECHTEAKNSIDDLRHLKTKVDCGAQYLVTQMFFDNAALYSFLYRALKIGIDVPVIAGVMPVINQKQILRSCALSGATLPSKFQRMIDRFSGDPESLKQAGIAYATEQIIDLISNGVSNIHIYTMNKPEVAGKIMDNLSSIL